MKIIITSKINQILISIFIYRYITVKISYMVIYVVPHSGITGQYCLVVLTGYTIDSTIALKNQV